MLQFAPLLLTTMHQPSMGMMTTPVFVDGVEVGDFVEGGVPVFYVGFQLLVMTVPVVVIMLVMSVVFVANKCDEDEIPASSGSSKLFRQQWFSCQWEF